jgi:hypothetical protein
MDATGGFDDAAAIFDQPGPQRRELGNCSALVTGIAWRSFHIKPCGG